MSSNSWNQTLVTAQVDGAALTNSSTATSILPQQAKFTLPANLLQIGTKLRIKASGRISTAASAPGTLTFDVRVGGTTLVFTSGASPTLTVSQTNATWALDVDLTMRAIGSTGNAMGTAVLGSAAVGGIILLPATAPVVGSNFDTTTSQQIDLYATFSVISASNSIQLHQYELVLAN